MYLHLTLLRMRWYAMVTGRVLVRHWQLFILAGVFVPLGTPIGQLLLGLAYPLLMALQVGHDAGWHLWRLVAIQAIALAWILVQRRAIRGGAFIDYTRALPISLKLRRWVDLSVLVPANSLLLIPVIASVVLAPTGLSSILGATNIPFLVATIGVVAGLSLLLQLAALEGRLGALWSFGLADALLSWGLSRPVDGASWLALGGTLLLGVSSLVAWRPGPARALVWFHRRMSTALPRRRRLLSVLPPAWRIQMQILWMQHPGATALRAAMVLGVAVAADGLMQIFAFDSRTLPTAIIAMAVIALIASGFYRTLQSAHRPMRPYLDALALPRGFWGRQDTACVSAFGAVPLAILLVPLLLHIGAAVAMLLSLVLAYFVLLALLRFPLVHGGRHAMLLAVIMASTWSGAAMAAVVR